jgi:hypothetical protein
MKIRAVKGPRNKYFVTLDNSSQMSWDWPSEGDALPHDLCHYAMEKAYGLKFGVYGLMALGVDWEQYDGPAALQRADAFVREHTDQPDGRELKLAEALANSVKDEMIYGSFDLDRMMQNLPPDTNREKLVKGIEAFKQLEARWRNLKMGEWIDLIWD